ncbi:amino acid ABC transporter permease [Paenibacillus hunanensis]|uniref:Polar amino acid transport system permease protein n=1 Tax=Paenibacillus hunanensis TaxID=539262 RepID=A0ABU1IU65_9BACL|nr:amino acid ABC transporter permease [Paenibacillus hunanensis]MCL9661658.1 amino acid ABC transporter permease [Paenibacillus hunanensis]MDR6242808.1 polar amino acid transport system permease protein [Paenibacillus hunanensis]WPP41836.1 amino acid ABC transporter permease [Paenibacillus hunanensis]GGJ02885.1 glutamine ABC transporter permease [Paenibacillus hunanensis]
MSDFRIDIILYYIPLLLKGTLLTIGVSIVSILLGSVLGLIVGFGRMSRHAYLRLPAACYINFFRGTPLLVQILLVHFGVVPLLIDRTDVLVAAILSLTLNSAGYSAEIFRAGIQSVEKGQTEAALSLGMNRRQTMRYIILPQAIKRMIPAFGNEFIVLIKDSSLLTIIAAKELMYYANLMRGQYLRIWEPYLTAALIYLILTYSLSKLLGWWERRMNQSEQH